MRQIIEQRKKLGLSQEKIANKCGIKQGYYSRIERGIHNPSVKLAKKLANILQISWTEFFN